MDRPSLGRAVAEESIDLAGHWQSIGSPAMKRKPGAWRSMLMRIAAFRRYQEQSPGII